MKFLVDESSDSRLAAYLTRLAHDAKTVAGDYATALDDREVLAIAHREGRILITNDRDFGELVFRLQQPHAGVIFFRLTTTRLPVKIERLTYVLTHYADQLDQFLVVTERAVRIRRQPQEGRP